MSVVAHLLMESASSTSASRRPPIRQQPAFAPPFDPSPDDQGNIVHTTLPPEQVISDHFADPLFIRADFNGTTIPGDYVWTGPAAQPGSFITITTGRWTGLKIPFLVGANSTPATMIMTPMLILYPQEVQEAFLTEQAERGYDDIVIAPDGWNMPENGFTPTPQNVLAWALYLKNEWGFRVMLWRRDPNPGVDNMLRTLVEAGAISFYIHGKEVDTESGMTAEQYEASLQAIDAYIASRIPIGVHFSANGDRHMGYPIGMPRETFVRNWSLYNGRVHLCQQLDVNASAGLQGSSMYYARLHVNCGIGDAAQGPGAPDSRVIAFETMATAQLYGACDEATGKRRSWELVCGTRDNPKARPVSGSANGFGYPNGWPDGVPVAA